LSGVRSPEEYTVQGKAGVPIDLPISSGPATGYHWEFELPEGVERYADSTGALVPATSHLGTSPGGNIRLTAVPGEHLVTARMIRPWNPDEPIRTARIRLRVSG
jgi:predicted secreted protein